MCGLHTAQARHSGYVPGGINACHGERMLNISSRVSVYNNITGRGGGRFTVTVARKDIGNLSILDPNVAVCEGTAVTICVESGILARLVFKREYLSAIVGEQEEKGSG